MKKITEHNKHIATRLAFALIPLSGLALDIFIPSLPSMAKDLHVLPAGIQLTLSMFLISLGICQLFIGSILDSFGRYIPNLIALAIFSLSNFVIVTTGNMALIDIMRILQGFCVAMIIVSKRAVIIDLHKGEELKKYTSMMSVVWAAAPIAAPFIGGFLEVHFGWRSNFSLLGFLGLLFLLMEFIWGGETIVHKHPFELRAISNAYNHMIKAKDFSLGCLILGFCYTMLMVYNMASPFIIESVLHLSPTIAGDAALVSGVAIMSGGMLARRLIRKSFFKKVLTALVLLEIASSTIMFLAYTHGSFYTLISYVILLHLGIGFVFNTVFSYTLTKFTNYGGKASGLAGGVYIIMTSALSQGIVSVFNIKTQMALGLVYIGVTLIAFLIFISTKWIAEHTLHPQKKSAPDIILE